MQASDQPGLGHHRINSRAEGHISTVQGAIACLDGDNKSAGNSDRGISQGWSYKGG